jgi:AMMECR1 domain-containing protein
VVRESELDDLVYSVDVLSEPEPIRSIDELDVKRYGVIVTRGRRRGLLLPNLEGINDPETQVSIAKQKAGIPQNETVSLERFEVVRHK